MCHKHFFSWIWRLFVKSSVLNKCKILYSAILTSKFHFGKWKYPQVIKNSLTFLVPGTSFVADDFFRGSVGEWGRGGGWGWFQHDSSALHLLRILFLLLLHQLLTDHQAVDPGGWGPLYKQALICLPCSYCFSMWGATFTSS